MSTEDGEPVTAERVRELLARLVEDLVAGAGDDAAAAARVRGAAALFEEVALAEDFPAFLTTAVDLGPSSGPSSSPGSTGARAALHQP